MGTGEVTWEPLSNIIASDPYTCAIYAKKHNLLNTPGWKLLKRHARTARGLIRTDTFLPKIPIAPCYCQMMG